MQVRKVRRRFLPILLSVALLPISAIVTASTAQAVGTPFACDATLYQISNGQLFKLNISSNNTNYSYTQVGSSSAVAGLDGAGLNPADNFIYANAGGTTLEKIASDGSITSAGPITGLTNTDGADFLTSDQMLAVGATSGTLQLITLHRTSGSVTSATTSTVTLSGTGFTGATDISVVPTTGGTTTAYALSGTTLTIFSLNSSSPTTATYTTKPISLLQNGVTGSFDSQWVDTQGNLYVWDGTATPSATTNALYEISATDITGTNSPIGASEIGETTFLGAGSTDGANCKTAPAPFAPQMNTLPTVSAITASSASITGYFTTNAYPVNPNGESNLNVCYSTSSAVNTALTFGYGLLSGATCVPDTASFAASTTQQSFTLPITGLAASTKYYYQIQATNTPTSPITPFVGYGSIQNFTTIAAAAFTSISPNVGTLAGGTTTTITGVSFTGTTSVTIGGVAANSFVVNSSTSISVTTPAGLSIGPADVVVTTPSGVVTGTNAFTYQTTVTYLSNGGSGTMAAQSSGVSTTLNTNTFTRTYAAFLGWNTAADGSGTSYANGTTYPFTADLTLYAQWMTVTGIAPTSGTAIGGTALTITGTNFGTATSAAINGVAITMFAVVNSTTITGTSPAGSIGLKDVTVTAPTGTATGHQIFTYASEPQVINFTSTPSTPTYGGTYTVAATGGGSGNAVTFTTATSAVCTVSGTSVHFVGNGTCTINANQASSTSYAAATQVQQTFTVATKALTISAFNQSKAFGAADPTFNFSTSGLVSPDVVTSVTFVRTAGETVGTYTITPSAAVFSTGTAANYTITYNTSTFTIDPLVTASAGANGSVSPSGTITATYGATQTISIIPNTGYHVADVQVDGSSIGAPTSYSFTNDVANHTISATFAINTYTLNYIAGSYGSVTGGASQVVNWSSNGATVTASPDPGYHFTSWSDGNLNASRTEVNVTANLTVTARFAINSYNLTVTAGSNGTTSLTGVTPEGYGDTQEVTFTPDTGYHIADVQLDGVSVGAVTSYILSNISAVHTLAVTFAINSYSVTYNAGSNGSITGTASQSVNYGSSSSSVTATANSGYHFVSWSDGVLTATRTDTNVTANILVNATFAYDTYMITASAGANGSISPNGSISVNSGDPQAFTITPAPGYHVLDVLVDAASVGAVTSYNFPAVAAGHTISATFALNSYTLIYSAGANGTLTGTLSQGVSSGGNGTAVAAVPNTGYHFTSWSDGVGTTSRTETNVTSNHTVVANFAIDTFTLTASAGSNGSISPTGSNVENYGYSQSVVIVPNTGYHVLDVLVDGASQGAISSYNFTNIQANHTISATFAPSAFTLTYTANTNGTLTGSTSQGLNYGGTGTAVTAVANTNYHFTAWSDGNTNPTRTDSNVKLTQTFTANFISNALVPLTYSVTSSGNTGGTVTPNGFVAWNSGDVVLVTFQANSGYHVSDVTVDGTSQGVIASYSINGIGGNHTIVATFAANAGNFSLTYTSNAHGSVTGNTSQSVASGGSGTAVNAVAANGYHFTAWSDGSTANPRTDTNVTAAVSVSAQFVPNSSNTVNLIYNAGANGSISGSSVQTINQGADGTQVVAVPAAGYHFVTWSDANTNATRTDTSVGANLNVTATFAQNSYTITYASNVNGGVSGVTSQSVVPGGSGTPVTAVPNANYSFSHWSDGGTQNPRTDTNVQYSATYTANFVLTSHIGAGSGSGGYDYTITSSTGANGTITPLGSSNWYQGDIAAFTMIPDTGYHVQDVLVDGGSVGAVTSYTFSNITADHTISVSYAINSYTLTYSANAHGSLSGTTTQSVSYGGNGSAITATAASGYSFLSWSDGSTSNPRTDTSVASDVNVIAEFVPNSSTTYNLIYSAGAGGSVNGAASQTVNQGADGGSVTATPATGYHFVNWSDSVSTATRTDTNVQANITVTANFAANTYTLTYVANANGTITGTTPQTVTGGTNGTQVTAVPNSNYHFTSWSDGSTSASRTESNVQGSITYTANFAANLPVGSTYTVTSSSGAGGVVSPVGVKVWNTGDIAGVYVVPNIGYHTVDVLVDGSSVGVVANYFFNAISADHTVSATFAPNNINLTYSASSNGTLTGATSQSVTFGGNGTTVSPVPNTGYHFTAWSDGSTANPRTDTSVSVDIAVTALFAINTYTITASASGSGTISPTGSVIDNYGQTQGFTFTPSTGYHVSQLLVDGGSAGTPNSYNFSNISANHTIAVTFAPNSYTLTYTANANGSITGTAVQNVSYAGSGTAVTPTPATGYHFVSWSDATSTNPRTDTNVTSNISVSATFAVNTYTIMASTGANGTISNVGSNPENYGDSQGFTITPNTGYQVATVLVDGSSVGAVTSYNFTNIQANHTIAVTFTPITFTLTYTTNSYGTLTGTTSQSVNYNASGSTVTANPQTGYHFTSWSDGSSNPTRTDANILANHTYAARFAINVYSVVSTTDTNGSISPLGSSSENYGYAQTYNMSPHTGYHIADVKVDGSSVGAVSTYTFSAIAADHTIDVTYAINTYTLTYTANAHGSVTGTTPQTVNWGTNGTAMTAVPAGGYHFTSWSDGVLTATRTDTNVTANISVSASFAIDTYTITSTVNGNGSISPLGTRVENSGSTQGYTITPATGYHTVSATVDGTNVGTPGSYTFSNIITNHTIDVVFAITSYSVTYTAGTGGTITGNAAQTVPYGSDATSVTATPSTGHYFVSWSSDGNTNPTRTDTHITGNYASTANFAFYTFTITPSVGPNGTASPSTATVKNSGSSQTVTFTPAIGYHVLDVLVDGVSVGAPTSYTFNNIVADHTISATFAIGTYTLTYAANANGTLLGATPQSVNYGGSGSSVSAVPSNGYHFTSWSDGSTANPRTDINVIANVSVTASFAINQYTLHYVAGSNGSVTGTPTQTVNYGIDGTTVTAVPASGYHFTSWSDGNPSAARTDTNVTSDHTFTASFALNLWTLTYTAGTGGTISGTASQSVLGGASGTTVTAIANFGYFFASWSDGVLTASRRDLNVNASASYTANFTLNAQSVTYVAGANGSIVGTAVQSVNYGSSSTSVTAHPNTGYHFVSWSDGSTSATRFETNVISNLSFTATFAINTYNISAIAGGNGSISSPGTTVANYGDNLSYSITPNVGYQVATVLVDGASIGSVLSYSFSAISAGHSIQVTFAPISYTVTASAGPGGTVNPNGTVIVSFGQSPVVTFSANSGFHIIDVLIDGASHGVITSYTFSAISANHSASVTFAANAANTHTVTYNASGNGSITGAVQQSVLDGGSTTTVTAVPNQGSTFDSWSDGSTNPVRTDSNIKSDLVFSAKFTTPSFIISASAGPNGSVTPAGNTSELYGSSLQVVFRPNTGYHVFNVQLDGNSIGVVGNYSFTNITKGHAISVTFAADVTETGPHSTPTPTPTPTKKPTPTPTSKPTPTPSTAPTPTPSGTPQPGPTDGPLVKEGTDGSKSTLDGTDDPTKESLLPNGNGVEVAGKDWKIQISSDKKSVYGIALPTSIKIFLIRGVNATTSGSGFLPGTIAKVYLFSTGIYLGQALVGPDGSFSTTFPVAAATTLGYHVMQVEGTSYDNKKRTASVGLEVINKPAKGLVYLGTIYYGLDVSILTPANIAKLAAIFTTIQNNGYKKIWIYGYTDIQTGVDNKLLSKHRSIRIAEMLNAILPQSIVGFKYFGPSNPKDKAKTEAAFAKNRRSEIWGQL